MNNSGLLVGPGMRPALAPTNSKHKISMASTTASESPLRDSAGEADGFFAGVGLRSLGVRLHSLTIFLFYFSVSRQKNAQKSPLTNKLYFNYNVVHSLLIFFFSEY